MAEIEIERLAAIGVAAAIRSIGVAVDDGLYEDMLQAAKLVIWSRCRGKGREYAIVAAKRAALQEWAWWMLNNPHRRHDLRGGSRVPDRSLRAPEVRRLEAAIRDEETVAFGMSEDMLKELVELLYNTRQKRGRRGLLAAVREANVIALVLRGYTNREIAKEMGMTVHAVKQCRRRARQKLERIAGKE